VLARVLTPADFGIIAMAAPIAGFIGLFRDLGLSTATVQRARVTHAEVNVLFWVNVGVSMGLVLVGIAVSPVVGWFYGDSRLTPIVAVLALFFLASGAGAQHKALLKRQMRLSTLSMIEVAAFAVATVAAIGAALAGASYWALVVLAGTSTAMESVLVWVYSGWRPTRWARADVGGMLRFGGNLTSFNLLNYVSRNADNVMLGVAWGAGPLGLYHKAYSLLLAPIKQINLPLSSVAMPALSRLQGEPEQYRRYYRRAVGLVAIASIPLVAWAFVTADLLVAVVLGEQWGEAAPIFRALAPAAYVGATNVATGWVYLSLGRTDRMLRWGLLHSTLVVTSFAVGLPWGPMGVALMYSAVVSALRVPGFLYCFRGTPLRFADPLSVLWRPTLASASAMLIVVAWRALFPGTPLLIDLSLQSVVFAAAYLGTWLALPQGPETVRNLLGLVNELRRRRPISPQAA